MYTTRRPIKERLLAKTVIRTGKCWQWTGAKTRGYGTIHSAGKDGRPLLAHRVSYELAFGPFDQSLSVCHKCDNPECTNPEHLFLGTHSDNMKDSIKKGRFKNPINGVVNKAKTHCKRGHEFTPDNTYIWGNMRHCRSCSAIADQKYRAAKSVARSLCPSSAKDRPPTEAIK